MICLPSSPISGRRAVCPLLVEPPTSLASISQSTAAAMSSTGGISLEHECWTRGGRMKDDQTRVRHPVDTVSMLFKSTSPSLPRIGNDFFMWYERILA